MCSRYQGRATCVVDIRVRGTCVVDIRVRGTCVVDIRVRGRCVVDISSFYIKLKSNIIDRHFPTPLQPLD